VPVLPLIRLEQAGQLLLLALHDLPRPSSPYTSDARRSGTETLADIARSCNASPATISRLTP
jgi:hypothetical protein